MNEYPIIRTRWSNEHIMTALFLVLILYHIPLWIVNPASIMNYLLLTVIGLFLDAAANMIRYRRLWCCVSGAVTAAIISLLTQGVPVWGQLTGLAAALIIGKYLWGGTGKNKINPAVLGILIIFVFWQVPYPFFGSSYLLVPAVILSLPFILSRPFAGLGYILGAVAVLIFRQDFNLISILSNGVFFWGCIVMTDPVTVTGRPIAGLISGMLAGVLAIQMNQIPLIFIAVILAVNLFSYILEDFTPSHDSRRSGLKIPKAVTYDKNQLLDLTGEDNSFEISEQEITTLTPEKIITIVKEKEVFGMGGAAFPTYRKLTEVLASDAPKKYLIINGVECDPGLIHDEYILNNLTTQLQKGIEVLKNCIPLASVHLAVKDTEGLDFLKGIEIHKIINRYPMGAEKLLIKQVLGISIEKKQFPSENGILVLNVQTIYAIYRAIYQNSPSNIKILTVANLKNKTALAVKVCLGMKLTDIIDKTYPGSVGCFAGGGVMQVHHAGEDEVVERNTNFIAIADFPRYKESVQCSNCGNCIHNCPAGLQVKLIADMVDQGKEKGTYKYDAADCMSCGICSYHCPAGRNLERKVQIAKKAMKDEYH